MTIKNYDYGIVSLNNYQNLVMASPDNFLNSLNKLHLLYEIRLPKHKRRR